jgi:hypothetical protein
MIFIVELEYRVKQEIRTFYSSLIELRAATDRPQRSPYEAAETREIQNELPDEAEIFIGLCKLARHLRALS